MRNHSPLVVRACFCETCSRAWNGPPSRMNGAGNGQQVIAVPPKALVHEKSMTRTYHSRIQNLPYPLQVHWLLARATAASTGKNGSHFYRCRLPFLLWGGGRRSGGGGCHGGGRRRRGNLKKSISVFHARSRGLRAVHPRHLSPVNSFLQPPSAQRLSLRNHPSFFIRFL